MTIKVSVKGTGCSLPKSGPSSTRIRIIARLVKLPKSRKRFTPTLTERQRTGRAVRTGITVRTGSVTRVVPQVVRATTCMGLRITIVGTPGNDTIMGTRGNDVWVATIPSMA